MAKKVSSKTHSQKQLDDYANQHNPNNKAYAARIANEKATKKGSPKREAIRQAKNHAKWWAKLEAEVGSFAPTEWYCYSNPYDFD